MSELIIAVLAATAVVYGTSATAKLRSRTAYRAYRDGLGEASLMPGSALSLVAGALAAAEAAVAVAATAAAVLTATGQGAGPVPTAALAAAMLLTLVLTAGVGIVLRRGTEARCACFGAGAVRQLSGAHLARNTIMLAALVAGLAAALAGLGQRAAAAPTLAGSALAVAVAATAALVLIHLDDIVELFQPAADAGLARRIPPTTTARWNGTRPARGEHQTHPMTGAG